MSARLPSDIATRRHHLMGYLSTLSPENQDAMLEALRHHVDRVEVPDQLLRSDLSEITAIFRRAQLRCIR